MQIRPNDPSDRPDPPDSGTFDVVVIGAGHNALISAAHLARAGLSVVVLEARDLIGGGAVTEPLTVPGFRHDTFSTGHPWLMSNAVLARDSLGLLRGGLRYVGHDPLVVLRQADGETLTVWRDRARTAAEFARFSVRDGEAWIRMLDTWDRVGPVAAALAARPPQDGPSADVVDPAAAEHARLLTLSAWEFVHQWFDSEPARAAALWFAAIAVQPLMRAGTGTLPLSVPGGWQRYGWINAIGGSSELSEGLGRVVREHGGRIEVGARVERILMRDARACGVVTADGRRFGATRAVVCGAHVARLSEMLGGHAPGPLVERVAQWRVGPSLFVVHLALRSNPKVRQRHGTPYPAVLSGRGSTESIRAQLENIDAGRLTLRSDSYMLAINSTAIDPSRAPPGAGVVKLVTSVPYALQGDAANWEAAKSGFADWLVEQYAEQVEDFRCGEALGVTAHSPLDIERTNASFHRGGPQGGEMVPDQMGPNRPMRGWAGYRLPIPSLYLTGSTAHPGGLVSGFPGENCARAVLHDLGLHAGTEAPDAASPTFRCDVIDTSARAG
jgi:phytoene dehydrogenase-like protein